MKKLIKSLVVGVALVFPALNAHALIGPFVQITTGTLQPNTTNGFNVSSGTIRNLNVQQSSVTGQMYFTTAGSVSSPVLKLKNGCGIYDSGTQSFRFGCNGSEQFSVDVSHVNLSTWTTTPTNSGLTPATPGATATDLDNRLAQIVNQIKTGFGITNWYDTVSRKGQVIQSSWFTVATSSQTAVTTAFVNSHVTTTLTNVVSGNKVKCVYSGMVDNTTATDNTYWTLARGSTNLGDASNGFGRATSGSGGLRAPLSFTWWDTSPGSGSVTYTVQMKVDGGTGGVCLSGTCDLLCEEIGQ